MEPRALWSMSVTLGTTLPALDGAGAYPVPGASQLWAQPPSGSPSLWPRAALLASAPLFGAADEGSSLPGESAFL